MPWGCDVVYLNKIEQELISNGTLPSLTCLQSSCAFAGVKQEPDSIWDHWRRCSYSAFHDSPPRTYNAVVKHKTTPGVVETEYTQWPRDHLPKAEVNERIWLWLIYFAVCIPHTLPTYRHCWAPCSLYPTSCSGKCGYFSGFFESWVMHKSTVMSPGVRGFIEVQKWVCTTFQA